MRFKQFLEFSGSMTSIPADPTSFWKLPSVDANLSAGTGFTGMFYRTNQKKQFEMEALRKLSTKAEQLAAAIRVPSSPWQTFLPYTAQMKLKPDVKDYMILNLALEDFRKTTGGGGYHAALTPFELDYAEQNKIVIPHPDNQQVCNMNIENLRNAIINFYTSYQGGLARAQLLDKGVNAVGSNAMQSVNGYAMTKSATGGV